MNPAFQPLRGADTVGQIVAAINLTGQGCPHPVPVLLHDRLQPPLRSLVELLTGSTPKSLISGADEENFLFVGVGQPEDLPDGIGHLAKAALAFGQGALGAKSFLLPPFQDAIKQQGGDGDEEPAFDGLGNM